MTGTVTDTMRQTRVVVVLRFLVLCPGVFLGAGATKTVERPTSPFATNPIFNIDGELGASLRKRVSTFAGLLALSWCVMTLTHEVGHLIGGWLGGATLQDCDLVPWRLPYSLHQPDPHPLLTLWSGPVLGVLIPLGASWLVGGMVFRFVADFCLLANGSYLATAWWSADRFLDTPRLLEAGSGSLSIGIYCAVTISVGYIRFRNDCVKVLSPAQEAKPAEQGPTKKGVTEKGQVDAERI